MNMSAQISPGDLAFNYFMYIQRSEIAASCTNSILIFLRNCHTASTIAAPFYSPNSLQRFQFFLILTNTCYFFFLIVPILMGLQWYLFVVLIHNFLVIRDVEHLFMCLLPICLSLEKVYSRPFFIFKSYALLTISSFLNQVNFLVAVDNEF